MPAGNDAFPLHIKDKYFKQYWESVGIRRHQFMELGSQVQPEGYEIFNLTILSLKLSRFRNGVSKLHGEVSRKLWKDIWPDVLPDEVPISHITNGVHTLTWTVKKMRQLFDRFLGLQWRDHLDDPVFWKGIFEIPDEELWQVKIALKEKMLAHLRKRLQKQFIRNKLGTLLSHRLNQMLKPEVLTLGFARRFATYKRATLIFRNLERLKRILMNTERPVQIIFAGKAHPRDKGGQELIRQIYQFSMQEDLRGKVFLIEGYDMNLARDLVSGIDVWLNNPLRPQEASGTSGQKVGMNAGINFSVLDGWWYEGFNGVNGWGFGNQELSQSLEQRSDFDSEAIYDILENDIIPSYYSRNENGVPEKWIQIMKQSLVSILPVFNTHRMLRDYLEQMYLPAIQLGDQFHANNFQLSREYTLWRERVENNWSHISIQPDGHKYRPEPLVLKYNEPFKLQAIVELGSLQPNEVRVQVFMIQESEPLVNEVKHFEFVDMEKKENLENGKYLYEAKITPSDSGVYRYTLRVLPYHPAQANPVELGLVHWLNLPLKT